ncbi:MAG: Flavobacterium phage Fpv3 [Bacteroidota bacterium]|jgi:group I intron endonuclease
MGCGIYKIENTKNNKIYIGSSIDIERRFYKHLWMLKKGIHDNNHLQNSFNEYGENYFSFSILELCSESDLVKRENFYIELYCACDSSCGYNQSTVNDFRRNCFIPSVKIKNSKYNLVKYGNFNKFSLTNLDTNETLLFEDLVTAANYLINGGFTNGNPRNVRQKLSYVLRKKKVNNGSNGSIRKTCYKHKCEIIN